MKSVKEATISSAKWATIERFSLQGIRFILGLIMARLLSPSDYGQISMIVLFIGFGDVLVDSGFSSALIRKKSHSECDFSTVFFSNLAISIFCYSVLFFSAPYIADFFNMPLLCPLLRVQSITLIIYAFYTVQLARLTIALDFKTIAKCNLISSLCSGIIGIYFAYNGFAVWALVIQTLASAVLTFTCVTIACKWFPKAIFSKAVFRQFFSFGSKLVVSNLINKIYHEITTIAIGKFYSANALGIYERGRSLAAFPTDNINGIMQKITLPIMAKVQDEPERLIGAYKQYIKILSIVIFYGCMLMAALANPIIIVLLGQKWAGAVIFLQISSFAVCFKHIDHINMNLLYVKGRSDLVLKLEIIKKTLSTLILICTIPLGLAAICFTQIIFIFITIICDSYYTGKFFNFGFIKQLKEVSPFFISALVSCTPAFLLTLTDITNWMIILISLPTSLIIYYLLLHNNSTMTLLLELLKIRRFTDKCRNIIQSINFHQPK